MVQLCFQVGDLAGRVPVAHGVPEQPLAQRRRHGRHVDGDVARDRHRAIQHLRSRQRPGGHPESDRLPPVEGAAGQQQLRRNGAAHQVWQRPMRHAVSQDTPPHLGHSIFGVLGDDPDVGLQCDGQSYPDGMAVDRRDHRGAQFECRGLGRRRGERVTRRRIERVCRSGEVGPRTERVPRAGEHDRTHLVIVVAVPVCLIEQRAHPCGVGVAPLRPVQGEQGDTVGHCDGEIGSHPSELTGWVAEYLPNSRHYRGRMKEQPR